eukprot:1428610-Prorocentrum_lima.AAC.1
MEAVDPPMVANHQGTTSGGHAVEHTQNDNLNPVVGVIACHFVPSQFNHVLFVLWLLPLTSGSNP